MYFFNIISSGLDRKYFPGEITRARLNGTYDIRYDDGDRETGVKAELIRSVGGDGRDGGGRDGGGGGGDEKFREGDKIEARHGGGRWVYCDP